MAAIIFAATAAGGPGGNLLVRISPGFEILVDGTSTGLSTADEGGKVVKNLVAGPHHVVVRSSDGREGAFDVSVTPGQTTDIAVSPLGLRRKADDNGSLRVVSNPDDCTIRFRGPTTEKRGGDVTIDAIPPGRYSLTVAHESKTLRTDDVPKGMVVTVQADFTSGMIQTIETRRRSRRIEVAEANDALTSLPVPPHWKTAVRGTLPAGASIVNATTVGDNGIKVTLRIPSEDVGYSLLESLQSSTAFSGIKAPSAPRREPIGWLFDLNFYFAAGH
ncbi:MAG TPA: hypothetical protein VIO12_06580 [Thermoanaerobaculia bacterium]